MLQVITMALALLRNDVGVPEPRRIEEQTLRGIVRGDYKVMMTTEERFC